MFESANRLIYFQNFNQESATLWYRINEKSLRVLKDSSKKCFLCLTNPAESIAYLIPLEEIEKQIVSSKYERDYLEINIDHISRKWKELDWNIKQFLKTYWLKFCHCFHAQRIAFYQSSLCKKDCQVAKLKKSKTMFPLFNIKGWLIKCCWTESLGFCLPVDYLWGLYNGLNIICKPERYFILFERFVM